ncbi:hypothetical protein BDB00DRAFT_604502 [Zychaea mexicana]|uniref:uncharacterized protein n=1 Tax=Zychaea mexicana TaxID=64656 RepID=UPI0022FF21B8|nr:uncharacterized protein BDB00DRAFT_604502 [Zychaea mexicana]KAI9489713.1 hypothetical protein BDB00DRAFT_604502 [Zychaea mexicana]
MMHILNSAPDPYGTDIVVKIVQAVVSVELDETVRVYEHLVGDPIGCIIMKSQQDGSDDSSIKKQNNRKNPDSNDNTNAVMESHIHQVQVHLEEEEIGKGEQNGSFRRWLVELKASICAPQTSAIPLNSTDVIIDLLYKGYKFEQTKEFTMRSTCLRTIMIARSLRKLYRLLVASWK